MELEATSLAQDGLYEKYANCDRRPDSRQVVQLNLKNLPASTTDEDLRKTAKAKHVVGVHAEIDNIKNECVGTGTFSCRLGEGETKEQIVQRFKNDGIDVEVPGRTTQKQNNYADLSTVNWKDARLQVQERRLKDDFGKVPNL